jgi:hypothetical protein
MKKNWRVNYFHLPFGERRSPQDFMWDEYKFNNYSDAEEKASLLEKSNSAYDVTIAIWDGDDCIEELKTSI